MNDGTGIAQQISSGTQSASSVTAAALERATQAQQKLNLFVTLLPEEAAAQAAQIDARLRQGKPAGALAGIPVAVKDNICVAGAVTTAGSRMLERFVPPYSATVVERLVKAGAVIVGKAALDEFAMGSGTETSAFGPTRNPWDASLVAGGSSGGSAAAVAAGVVPIALGTDTGGSVRQPAAFCGVVGFKPTFGLLSRWGVVPLAASLDHVGVFTRSSADLLTALRVMAGADERDSTTVSAAAAPALPDNLPAHADLQGLRIGVLTDLADEPASLDVRAALDETVRLLQQLGASAQQVNLPAVRYAAPAYLLLCAAEAGSSLARITGMTFAERMGSDALGQEEVMQLSRGAALGSEARRRILLGSLMLQGEQRAIWYQRAVEARQLISSQLQGLLGEYDVILCPVAPDVAYPLQQVEEPGGETMRSYRSGTATVLANLAGLPAVSVPGARNSAGLPVGVQFVAARHADMLLLRITAALEAVRGAEFSPVASVS